MKYAGPFRGKILVFLAMIAIATYIAIKAVEPLPDAVRPHSAHPGRHR